jgi:2-hydroxy-6-oxonona-2,4-dienedioate hydrolase
MDNMSSKRETYFETGKADYFTRIYHSRPVDIEQETIVLVHGLGISGTYMHLLAMELGKKYRVYVPDLPGFGYSSKPPHTLNIQELADALYDWAKAASVSKAYYLGNSTGCQVIVDFAIHYKDMVKGVILQGPTIDPHQRSASRQISQFLLKTPDEPPSQMLIMIKDYGKCGIKRVRKTFEYALIYETEKFLPEVNVPALVVRGGKDGLVSQEWAEEAAELLPQGSLKVIPGVAHTVNMAMPEELANITDEFIENIKVKKYENTTV